MRENVDPKEVAKFSSKDSWWDTSAEFKPLHDINPVRLEFIQQQINLQDKTVLDVGCGGGILTESLAKCGAKVTGLDVNDEALEQAKAHAEKSKLAIEYVKMTIEKFAESKQQFDVITCMELLEHAPDPASIIHAAKKLIKPQGKIFFATINRNTKAFIQAIVFAEYLLNLLPKGTHDYEKFIRPSELASWLRNENFMIEKITGMKYHPLIKTYKLSKDTSVNYLLAASAQ